MFHGVGGMEEWMDGWDVVLGTRAQASRPKSPLLRTRRRASLRTSGRGKVSIQDQQAAVGHQEGCRSSPRRPWRRGKRGQRNLLMCIYVYIIRNKEFLANKFGSSMLGWDMHGPTHSGVVVKYCCCCKCMCIPRYQMYLPKYLASPVSRG